MLGLVVLVESASQVVPAEYVSQVESLRRGDNAVDFNLDVRVVHAHLLRGLFVAGTTSFSCLGFS